MEYTILKIIKGTNCYIPGSIITVTPMMAQILIDDGIAERYVKKKNKDQENGD